MIKTIKFATTTAALAVGLSASASVMAADTTLIVGTWLPPTAAQNAVVWPTWAKWVEEATEGRVEVKIEYDVGHPKTYFQLVEDGVIDAGFSYHGYVPGRFKLPLAVEQPGLGVGAEAASVALWRTQQKHFDKANEFVGLELLGMFTHGPGQLMTTKPVSSIADLEGMKIRTMTSPLLLETYTAFGASPIAMPWGELIGGLKTKMVDGQENPTIWIEAYDLDNLTNVMTYTGHGQYTTAVMANADFYDGLSDADKQLVQNASQAALDYILDVAVELDATGLAKIKETNPDYIINRLTAEERAPFKERAKAVEAAFVERAGERGAAILEQMKADLLTAQQ